MTKRRNSIDDGTPRSARVQQVIDDCIDRRAAGEAVSDDSLIVAHADLMPELAEALQALEKAKKSGVQLIRFGKIKSTRDAHGLAHPPELIAFLKDVPVVGYADARALSNKF